MIGGRTRAALLIALIVLCSALAGAAVDRVVMRRMPPSRVVPGVVPVPVPARTREADQRRRVEMLDHLTKDLHLTPAQRSGIDSVMKQTDSTLRAIRSEMQPRIETVFVASRAQIGARLDSAQKVKFEKSLPKPRR